MLWNEQIEHSYACSGLVVLNVHSQMRALENERLAALESAARARAEVAELSESRRKLEWQSKLLEKMSEVRTKV